MGEIDWHPRPDASRCSVDAIGADAYVAADMMLYYEEGNPKAIRSPDCMVVLGVPEHIRATFG